MYTRNMAKPTPQEVDIDSLHGFQTEVVNAINELQRKVTDQQMAIDSLQVQSAIAGRVLTWMQEHRPEALQDYETTKQVVTRLENSNDGEVMTESMV